MCRKAFTEAHKTGKESIYLNTLKYQNKILSIYNSRTGTLYHYLQITDTNMKLNMFKVTKFLFPVFTLFYN